MDSVFRSSRISAGVFSPLWLRRPGPLIEDPSFLDDTLRLAGLIQSVKRTPGDSLQRNSTGILVSALLRGFCYTSESQGDLGIACNEARDAWRSWDDQAVTHRSIQDSPDHLARIHFKPRPRVAATTCEIRNFQ